MRIKMVTNIKAILFGVEENVIGKLNIGNDYCVTRDTMMNRELWREFDYTDFGIRRVYEEAKVNNHLDVAILEKSIIQDIDNADIIVGKGIFINGKMIDEYVNNMENQEMNYSDVKMRLIRLYSESGFNIKELLINTEVKMEDGNHFNYNNKVPFPDRIYGDLKKLSLITKEETESINRFLCDGETIFDNSKFDTKLLKNSWFLYEQSLWSPVVTLRYMTCVIGIEGLLVDGNTELTYRLSRNCAMLLSDNVNDYKDLFSKMKKIYKKRSEYVHNGFLKELDEKEVTHVRKILREVIFKIIEKNISKDQLLEELDIKGY